MEDGNQPKIANINGLLLPMPPATKFVRSDSAGRVLWGETLVPETMQPLTYIDEHGQARELKI